MEQNQKVAIPRVESRTPSKNTIEWEIPGKVSVALMLVERVGYTFLAKVGNDPTAELFTASSPNAMEVIDKVSDFLEKYGYYIDSDSIEFGEKVGDPDYFK